MSFKDMCPIRFQFTPVVLSSLWLPFQSTFKLRGQYTSKEQVAVEVLSIFHSLDLDRDEKISQEEFIRGAQETQVISLLSEKSDLGDD